MVVSKKCKICAFQDANNIPISGEYYDKQIPQLIQKICGIELDARKLNGILLCQQCSTLLVYTESVIDRLQKSMQRLRVINKLNKTPKTATKEKKIPGSASAKKTTKSVATKAVTPFKKLTDDSVPGVGSSVLEHNAKRKLSYNGDVATLDNESNNVDNTEKSPKRVKKEPGENCNTEGDGLVLLNKSNSKKKKRENNNSFSLHDHLESNMDDTSVDIVTEEQTPAKKCLNCVLCGKVFNQKSALREHIESSHLGEKLKECPNCFMEFRSQQKYDSHVFNEKCKTTLHPCQSENCNRRFKNARKMEIHMQEKHSSQNDYQEY